MSTTIPSTERLSDRASEGCVLASMMMEPHRIPSVLAILQDREAFFFTEHRMVFDAIMAIWRRDGSGLDAALVRSELSRLGQTEKIGGVETLQEMLNTVPTTVNAVYYARRVQDRRRYRELVSVHADIGRVLDDGLEVDEQVRRVQEITLGLQPVAPDASIYPVGKHATRVAIATQARASFVPTGLRNIDWYIGGLMPGRLIVPAGRPGMGKTALATTIALYLAQAGQRVLFFTLEMSADELMERMISVLSGVNLREIRRADPHLDILNRFYAGSLELEKLPIVILENHNTVEQQVAAMRHYAATEGLDAVFVDYMQLMTTGRRIDNRVQEVSAISRGLKLAAVREHVPVVAMSQLNRECEGRDNHRPRLSDLRESGSLEQDADIVLMLHREDYYRRQKDPQAPKDGVTDCIIAKHRGGPCGIAGLFFLEETTRFSDLAQGSVHE